MRTCLQLMLVLMVTLNVAYAQQKKPLSGIVMDENDKPIFGVSVAEKGSTKKVETKENGTFSITLTDPVNGILVFTYVGYDRKEVAVSGKTNLIVNLNPNANRNDEVVVVSALGLTKKARSVTYSSQSVDPERLTEARDVNIVNGLAGKVVGLQVTTSGQPGSSSRVVIRGETSLTGNNQPLWVVDGVPIANNTTERDNLNYGGGAADLNPDDIESIEVLRGPNAAALYGSMAANGAILVTTKKGKIGDKTLGISVNQNMMWYTITEFPAYQNIYGEGGSGRLVIDNNRIAPGTNAVNMGTSERTWGAPMLGQPYNDFSGKPIPGGYTPQPDNITAFYKTSLTNTSNISINKSDAVSSFRLSYTYTKGNDVLINQNLRNKHNVNLFVTRKFGKRVSVDARVLWTNDDMQNRTYRNLDPASPLAAYVYISRSANLSAFTPWANPNGDEYGTGGYSNTENPYWMIYENKNQDTRNRYISGVTATIEITKSLKLRGQATGDIATFKGFQYKELGGLKTAPGFYSNRMEQEQNWNYEALLMFNKRLNSDFNLVVNAGTNLATFSNTIREAFIDRLLVHDMPSITNANAVPRVGEALNRRKIYSVYGNATLAYKDFLFLDMTSRNDWSSTLPPGNNSYFYPSFGTSFVFSNFIKDKSILSYGKLRASWAKVGNSAPPYSLTNTWSNGGLFLNNPTFYYGTTLKNPNLKPEQTTSREVGLEMTFFKQRLNLTATVYRSSSTNQILTAQTPTETGFTNRVLNAGEMVNHGIELTANINAIKNKNFLWNMTLNWSQNKNMVKSLTDNVPTLQLGSNLGITVNAMPGRPYGVLLGNVPYKVGDTVLVQPANGRIFYESNKYVGNFRPDWIGSVGNNFKYKNIDFSFLVTVKWGGSLYSASMARAGVQGNTIESLFGRDEFYFSNIILGENGNERQGIGQTVGTTVTPYNDSRAKGARIPGSYLPKMDAKGNILYDANGRMMVGNPNPNWTDPQTYFSDYTLNNAPAVTYDATSIKLMEMVIGYNFSPSLFGKNGFIKGARLAAVGRNLWQIYRRTPRGIDPESANTSGNAQGIESGGSFPYAQYGIDFKINF